MEVLVCLKRVVATGGHIPLTGDERHIDTRHLGFTIGPHEECAVEEAVRLTEKHGGSVTALTAGPDEAVEQLRTAISMGAHDGVLVTTTTGGGGDTDNPPEDPDAQATARAITAAVRELAADGRSFDLLLFGTESADAGRYQVGVRVAYALGLPMVGGIKGLTVDAEAGEVELERPTGGAVEIYRAPLPAAVGVKEGINLPRYPSLRGRMKAKKAEIRRIEPDLVPGGLALERLRLPPESGNETVIVGRGPDAAPAVADLLAEWELI
jgi:electron transfer flavoprotein beta subunit